MTNEMLRFLCWYHTLIEGDKSGYAKISNAEIEIMKNKQSDLNGIKNLPAFVTFTGIDDRTDLTKAEELAEQYPIEYGVLFSLSNRDARYPCYQAILEMADMKTKKSAHLCGAHARKTAEGHIEPLALWFSRIQINGISAQDITDSHRAMFQLHENTDFIFQCKTGFSNELGFYQLFDCSGGRGVLPTSVPYTNSDKLVGYAGGMGPDTVKHYLSLIQAKQYWIDMETHIRTDGWFDLEKCRQVCEQIWG